MDANKKNTENVARLIESLSELAGHDLEDSKALLKAAGRDPDQLIENAIKHLKAIQKKSRKIHQKESENKIYTNSPILFFDNENKKILLRRDGLKADALRVNEVFETLLENKPLRNVLTDQLNRDEIINNVKLYRITAGLKLNIYKGSSQFMVQPYLHSLSRDFPLSIEQTFAAIEIGYVIVSDASSNTLIPVDPESAEWSKIILNDINDNCEIAINKVIKYYVQKKEHNWLTFSFGDLNLDSLINSDSNLSKNPFFIRELYDYQKDGLKWLMHCCANKIGGILGDDMGLGKTAQVIALIAWVIEHDIFSNILIVIPGTLIENWKREFEFFAPTLIPYIHHSISRTGSISLLEEQKIVITSYSIVINDRYLLNKLTWGLVICDEASLIKNPDSGRRISLSAIPAEVRIAMTGTPVENSLIDLWSLADFVNPAYLGSRSDFSLNYIRPEIEKTLTETNLTELRKNISHIMLRRKKEDVLDSLPEKIDIHQALEMSETEGIYYDLQRKKLLTEFNTPVRGNILKEIIELRQYTTHPLLIKHEKNRSTSFDDLVNKSIKFTRTIELLDEIKEREEKVLIFTEYLDMIDMMQSGLSLHYGIKVYTIDGRIPIPERQLNIDRFTREKGFGIILLNPRTAGMGLNITAANHVIHYTRQWNPALEEQASARAYRNGQMKGVNIYYLYYANTIEEIIDNRLKIKKALSGEVITETSDEINIDQYLEILSKSPVK